MTPSPELRMIRAVNFRGRQFWSGTVAWIIWFVFPLLPGWLVARAFDQLQQGETGTRFRVLLVSLLAAETAAALFIRWGHRLYMQGLYAAVTSIRANALAAQLTGGGPGAAPRRLATGDALARIRDDPLDMVNVLDGWTDLAGSLVYGIGVVWLLAGIDPWAAAVGIVPLFVIGAANIRLGQRARRYRQQARTATSTVTGFLDAVFAAALTIKLGDAPRDVVGRLDTLNDGRSRAMVADQLWEDCVWSVNGTLTDVSVGLSLVVAARGPLDAGEISLFAGYLFSMVWLPQRLGGLVVGRRRYDVSARRIGALLPEPRPGADPVVEHRPLPVLGGPPAPRPEPGVRVPLHRLDVDGLTVATRGLHDVSFQVRRGQLLVVSGPIGAGKSSLLRALVGLVPLDAGEVRWNGEPVDDRAAFFVPPRCAYVAQVPHLFAESLADNLALGHEFADDDLLAALSLAAFDEDLIALPQGLATLIGSRGVRLSGGQAQRVAAARAFVHRPELLVLDDLASALDIDTEIALWDRLAAAGCTIVTATNRAAALDRADVIVRLSAAPDAQFPAPGPAVP